MKAFRKRSLSRMATKKDPKAILTRRLLQVAGDCCKEGHIKAGVQVARSVRYLD